MVKQDPFLPLAALQRLRWVPPPLRAAPCCSCPWAPLRSACQPLRVSAGLQWWCVPVQRDCLCASPQEDWPRASTRHALLHMMLAGTWTSRPAPWSPFRRTWAPSRSARCCWQTTAWQHCLPPPPATTQRLSRPAAAAAGLPQQLQRRSRWQRSRWRRCLLCWSTWMSRAMPFRASRLPRCAACPGSRTWTCVGAGPCPPRRPTGAACWPRCPA